MFSRDSVGSSSDSSCSSWSSYASSSGSFPSIVSTIFSIFSCRSTPIPESPTSSLQSPQDKAIKNVSNVTYFESKSINELLYHQIPIRKKLLTVRPTTQNGPSTLARLQDVQDVQNVAFGIFDRYYIVWEDTQGERHQGTLQTITWLLSITGICQSSESDKLPQLLYDWLHPESGQTRHLPL
ncbi:hypothetical protein EAE99_010986 [Botrytis elliptica]|nr:hypothetical protein EAE99_010986 [Botrytis elliptica]